MAIDILQMARDRYRNGRSLRMASGVAFKITLAAGALLLCWRVAAARFADFDGAVFWAHLSSVSLGMIALATVAAALSYAAISCYDVIAIRALGLKMPVGKVLRTGAAATALGQLFGFGVIIGAFTRWRMLRRDGVTQPLAAAASAIVAIGFLGGLTVLAGVAALIWPSEIALMTGLQVHAIRACGAGIMILFVAIFLAGHRQIAWRIFGRSLTIPRPLTTGAQVGLAAVDVFFAAAVLWLLTPAAADVSFGEMFLAYIGVLAICLLANTPGGVGPLEGALLFALPHAPTEALLAGIIAFRAVYYATPGLIGLITLIDSETGGRIASQLRRKPQTCLQPPLEISTDTPAFQRALAASGRAEDELAYLGDKHFFAAPNGTAFLMYRQRGRTLVAIGDPIGQPDETPDLCEQFLAFASEQRLTPVFYKIGPTFARAARLAGMKVGRVGREAVIDLSTFTIADRARREIRRKVRQAAKAGVVIIAHPPGTAPLASYAALCAEWQTARGTPETSFSMGRCDAEYLSRFPIYEARVEGIPVGFLSVWRSGDGQEWSIDIMRHATSAPPGVMHALIVAACDGARAAGARQFNLCLAPLSGLSPPLSGIERLGHLIFVRGRKFHGLQGLYRFKASFRPEWFPRYVAHPRGMAGLSSFWAIYQLIHSSDVSPTSLCLASPDQIAPLPEATDEVEDYRQGGPPLDFAVRHAGLR